MIVLPYLIIVGLFAWIGFGMWCITTGRVNVMITDMTGEEPGWFRFACLVGASILVTWAVVETLVKGDPPDGWS